MSRRISQAILVYLALILVLILINVETVFPIIEILRAILVFSLATFIPGYLFTLLFLDKDTQESERLVISVALSISFVILLGVLIHLLGIRISVYNILNPLWFIVSVSVIGLMFVKRGKKSKKKIELDGLFYLNLSMVFAFFLILVFISINLPSNEGFVEVYWDFVKVENPWVENNPVCEIDCSLSGINKLQKARIGEEEYSILFLDINQPGKYDSICVDFNDNSVHCESNEGPFWSSLGFNIGNKAYSYNIIEDGVVIFNYPKKLVNRTSFEVSYFIRSNYENIMRYEVILKINDEVSTTDEVILESEEKKLFIEEITIPEQEKHHKIEIIVIPGRTKESAKINFFVEYSTEF